MTARTGGCPDLTLARGDVFGAINNPGIGGGFVASQAMWAYDSAGNSGSIDSSFTQTMEIGSQFPNNTRMSWSWPDSKPSWDVYGFPAIIYGLNGGYTISPGAGPPSTQLKNFNTLTSTFDYTYTDPDAPIGVLTSNFDVCFDFFLTSVPYSFIPTDGLTNYLFEVLIYVHPNFVPAGTHLLSYTSAGATWDVHLVSATPPVISVHPSADVLSGTFDIKGLFVALIAQGTFSGNEYLDGIGFGAEPAGASGTLTVNTLSYVWN